ncbi:DUF2332 domain-containing protein [Nocardioides anomalus]|uniref:DUF2332 domain-containing protein n=1 Tax=Nocardioides anomalus TaxID=2712223 RepID=A0A6G6WIH0_9ACTN|nr:DUF2332 domain-containing protein [Nocardioides anomalus]QIG45128.1 DUF2332 domain-containing protein [Nocardioides anomalus]
MEPYAAVVDQYTRFAAEARDESPCFAEWALGVASDPEVLASISSLPGTKKQPNLVFAAARWHGVPAPGPYAGLRAALLADDGRIRATVLERATQTNEVGRLATLLPAFPTGPLALLEVGASAGLNLFPDRWGYSWTPGHDLGPEPRLRCAVTGPAPLPTSLPDVRWRGGIDLHPLAVTDPDDVAWLEVLVWPEQEERRERLRHAVAVAREDPPHLVPGDLLTELPALVAEASAYGTVVVFHSAVAVYLAPEDRERMRALMTGLVADGACTWISNEAPGVFPAFAHPDAPPLRFQLSVDGRAVGFTQGHGHELAWLDLNCA